MAAYAHTAMSEMTVVLAVVLFLTVAWPPPGGFTPLRGAALAAALCGALACRESLLLLAPVAGYILWQGRWTNRRRGIGLFVAVLIGGVALLLPLYGSRAPYPHFLSDVPSMGGGELIRALLGRAGANLLAWPGDDLVGWVYLAQAAVACILPLGVLVATRREPCRTLAVTTLFLFAGTFLGLVGVYPLKGWAATRVFMFTTATAALLLAAVIAALPSRWWRVACGIGCATVLGLLSFRSNHVLALERAEEHSVGREFADFVVGRAGDLPLRGVIADTKAFQLGWIRYPVIVVWQASPDIGTWQELTRLFPIDAMVVRTDFLVRVRRPAQRGALGARFRRVGTPWNGYQMLLRDTAPADDCNGNGEPDRTDIVQGTSRDADGNGVPDECRGR
jgi:hypothetical protein